MPVRGLPDRLIKPIKKNHHHKSLNSDDITALTAMPASITP
jgi:hypothetical protein